jgi:general secretion pathway protein D
VGISVIATPRVTDEGDILLELQLNNAALGPSRTVGGSPAPSFTNRKVAAKLRLRDGESHLIAGLLQDEERKTTRGFPGVVNLPILKHLFSDSDSEFEQTDIVMLLTPRITRTHEWTTKDLSPIHLGTNQNLGLTGPPPLIAPPPEAPAPGTAPGPPPAGVPPPPQGSLAPGLPGGAPSQATMPVAPLAEPQPTMTPSPQATTLAPTAQVSVTAPTGDVRVASGPYMVPVFITGVSRLSTASITVTYNPAALRVRTIQEGSLLRQGGATASMTPNIDHTSGRIDLAFVRTGDVVGASGSGLLAGIQFDAIAPGSSPLGISGVATNPSGATIPLQFVPATIVVR